jgi:hypothetical protein
LRFSASSAHLSSGSVYSHHEQLMHWTAHWVWRDTTWLIYGFKSPGRICLSERSPSLGSHICMQTYQNI